MRFFIALKIPEASKKQLEMVQGDLIKLIPRLKLTDADKLHLTIAFIGEQSQKLKEPLINLINQAVAGIPVFEITPAYIDGFPNLHNPNILWTGVKGDIDKLFLVRERIKDGLLNLGLQVDERRYTPHIALAKIGNFKLYPEIEQGLQNLMRQPFQPIKVSSIVLIESIPNHDFHQHNTLAEIKLTNG